jgi:NAD+ dependent glucose-6-phosphate dehydrogenase
VRNVFEAARQAGVRRVVYASSSHVVAGHERAAAPQLYELDDRRTFGVDIPVWPDSLYGATKAFGEAVARWYADAHAMDVVCLRIGWVWDGPDEEFMAAPDDAALTAEQRRFRRRSRAIWLSQHDCGELFRRALDADVRWALVYATSDNPRQIWDLEPARRLLGFVPRDRAPA